MPELLVVPAVLVLAAVASSARRRALVVSMTSPPSAGDMHDAQLREEVERAWSKVSVLIDRLIGSGQLIDRELLLDLARFLESAMPAVAAYERLLARIGDETDLAALVALPGRERS